jgi:hypothetical protein
MLWCNPFSTQGFPSTASLCQTESTSSLTPSYLFMIWIDICTLMYLVFTLWLILCAEHAGIRSSIWCPSFSLCLDLLAALLLLLGSPSPPSWQPFCSSWSSLDTLLSIHCLVWIELRCVGGVLGVLDELVWLCGVSRRGYVLPTLAMLLAAWLCW